MYSNITEHCKEVINRSSRRFAASFFCEDVEYSDVKSFRISVPSANNGMVTIGATISNSIEIVVGKVNLIAGQAISVYDSVKLDTGKYESIPMGLFYISKSTTKDGYTTIKAEGPLSHKLNSGYFSELDYPTTNLKMLEEISEKTGVIFDTSTLGAVSITTKPEGYTCREIVGLIAGLSATNAMEARDGTIVFKWFEHSEDDVLTDKSGSPELESSFFVIQRFECSNGKKTIIRGTGTTGISISNPFVTDTIADAIWEKVSGFSFRPGNFPIVSGTPLLDVWDSFVYNGDRIIATEIEYYHDGGLQNTYSSSGGGSTATTEGPVAAQLKRYYAELITVKTALIDTLTVQEADVRYLKAGEIDAITLVVKEAAIEELSSEFVTTKTIEAEYANITFSNVEKSTIGTLFADVGLITSATIVDGHVTGYLNSVEVNANSITAGTLSVDRLVFRGNENSIVYELNNITGALQAVQGSTLNGEILTDRSITVDKIVARSITANEIAVGTITANEIAAKAITAEKIDVEDLFSQNITANNLKITGNSTFSGDLDIKGNEVVTYNGGNSYVARGFKTDTATLDWQIDGEVEFTGRPEVQIKDGILKLLETEYDPIGIIWAGERKLAINAWGVFTPRLSTESVMCKGGIYCDSLNAGTITAINLELFGTLKTEGKLTVDGAASIGGDVTTSGRFFSGGYISLPNDVALYGKDSSGTNRLLAQLTSSNAYKYGTGGVANTIQIGSSYTSKTSLNGEVTATKDIRTEGNLYAAKGHVYVKNGGCLYAYDSSGNARTVAQLTTDDIYGFGVGEFANSVIIGNATKTSEITLRCTSTVKPSKTGAITLGTSSYRWKGIYSAASVNVSSDRRLKDDIQELDEKYIRMIDMLMPKTFFSIYDDGESRRRRVGYIAQEVEEAALSVGLTLEDCNFIHKDWIEREDYTGDEYALNYDDLAVIVHGKVQKHIVPLLSEHEKRILELERQLAVANALIAQLQSQQLGA